MSLANQKGLLAKLLATENITVEHQPNAKTAAFDVKNRKMILPVFKEMSGDLYDLLVGHETGHAFETPAEGWHDAVIADTGLKSFLNIVEDARIERKVQDRYPGLRKSFVRGYKRLMDMDFFGVQGIDLTRLPLIDRINLHFKVGNALALSFTPDEQVYVDRVAACETWDEVVDVATDLRAYSKDEASTMENLLDSLLSESSEGGEGDEELGNTQSKSKGEKKDAEETSESQSSVSESTEDVDDGDGEEGDPEGGEGGKGDIEPENQESGDGADGEAESKLNDILREFADNAGESSFTDDSFRENEGSLVNRDRNASFKYVNFKPFDMEVIKKVVVDYPKLYEQTPFESDFPHKAQVFSDYKAFERSNQPLVSGMAQSFMRKQRAAEFRRAQIHKTGELATDRLWAYKTSEDLFQRNVVVPDGKNHGFIMYVDMSQSMWDYMHSTVKQVITLAMFARKINVPFEVYGFTVPGGGWEEPVHGAPEVDGVGCLASLKLYTLLSSRMRKNEMNDAMAWLFGWSSVFTRTWSKGREYGRYLRNEWHLASTPLNNAMLCGVTLAKMFQQTYNVEVLNTVLLTDGDATDGIYSWRERNIDGETTLVPDAGSRYNDLNVLKTGSLTTFPNTDMHHRLSDFDVVTRHYKELTGSVMINYHITDQRRDSFNQQWERFTRDFTAWDASTETIFKEYRKQGWTQLRTADSAFDSRFLIREKNLDITEMELESKSNKTGDLTRAFKKYTNGNKNQRVLLNRFAEAVA